MSQRYERSNSSIEPILAPIICTHPLILVMACWCQNWQKRVSLAVLWTLDGQRWKRDWFVIRVSQKIKSCLSAQWSSFLVFWLTGLDFSEFPFLWFLCPVFTIKSVCLSVVFFLVGFLLCLSKMHGGMHPPHHHLPKHLLVTMDIGRDSKHNDADKGKFNAGIHKDDDANIQYRYCRSWRRTLYE